MEKIKTNYEFHSYYNISYCKMVNLKYYTSTYDIYKLELDYRSLN